MPERIQRQRTAGWRMPAGAVYVGRPSRWGNPFRVSDGSCSHPDCGPGAHEPLTADKVLAAYRQWLDGMLVKDPAFLEPLRGRDLACWCRPGAPCHADVLLEVLAATAPKQELTLSVRQVEMARHALGLDGRRKMSYRNHYVVGAGSEDHAEWLTLVSAGAARRRAGSELTGGDDLFWLTAAGARAVLLHGEKLDPEDFPVTCSPERSGERSPEQGGAA